MLESNRWGLPLPETQCLLLDEQGELCDESEPGEIVIRTPFRSHGYINAPEEQQKRFIRNPFRDDPRICSTDRKTAPLPG